MHALVLTDAVDSTALSEALSPVELAARWAEHDRLARDLLVAHGGREIDKSDGFLLLFERVQDAVAWALAYHRASPLPARAGVHWGHVILRENSAQDVARGAKMLEVEGLAKPIAARIMSLAMAGQTLLSREAAAELGNLASGVAPVSHGFWRVKGVSEPMELFEVGEDQAPFQPPPDSEKVWRVVQGPGGWLPLREVPRSLPAERDSFVGRQRDLRALAQVVDSGARLVSIVGTGGTGKTRLALRYAWRWLGAWSGGAAFCDLSEARSINGIAKAVANAMELPLRDTEPVQQVGKVMAERGPTLVVLDNFEQVARYASHTLGKWLDQAPQVQFLVTTREVLGIPGERILALPPLSQADGVALFNERARRARGQSFEGQSEEREIAAVVELVDRLPLAIELAAARCRSMSPKNIRERMGQRFRLLASSGGRQDRQATLRATLDWSWDLLDSEEQAALAQLSVFEGAFDLSAVEAVVHTEQDSWPADLIQALVDKSLVRTLEQDRFGLLISVHDYAREKLASESEATLRHLRHYARWGAPSAIDALRGPEGSGRWQEMLRGLDNLIAACRRAVAMQSPALAAQSFLATNQVLTTVGPLPLGEQLARPVLRMAHPPATRIRLQLSLAQTLGLMGKSEQLPMLEDCLSQTRLYGDPLLELRVLAEIGNALTMSGELEEAEGILRLCLSAPDGQDDLHLQATVHNALGLLTSNMGRSQEARSYFSAAVALHRQAGNRGAEARALGNLGSNAPTQAENLVHLRAALALHQSLGNRRSEAIVLGNLGRVCRRLGRVEESYAHARAALRLQREVGNRRSVAIQLLTLGSLDRVHDVPGARSLLEEALMVQKEIGFRRGQAYCCAELAMWELGQGDLAQARSWAQQAEQLSQGYSGARVQADAASALIYCAQDQPKRALALIQQTPMTEKTKPLALSVWAWAAALSGDRVQVKQCLAAIEQLPEALIEEPRALREQTLKLLERGL